MLVFTMNARLAKQFVNLAVNKWKNSSAHRLALENIVDFLVEKNDISKKYIFDNTFEFSLVENSDNIRMLHLLFWKDKIPPKNKEVFIKSRQEIIIEIFKNINEKFYRKYNIEILKFFFAFNQKRGSYPVQFGLEYNRNLLFTILKVYLSINGNLFPLKKFCNTFDLNYKILKEKFKDKKFDAIALDFLSNGKYSFKFYPLTNTNKGLLYRVDKETKISSVKDWARFSNGLELKEVEKINFLKLPAFLKAIITKNNFRIHYLSRENDKKSIYFR